MLAATTASGLLAIATPVSAGDMSQKKVEEHLTCQCGCGLTVRNCNHLQCSSALPIRDDIKRSLAAGESGEEILARYADTYGEKILSAPGFTGFNLLAWTMPAFAVLLGGLLIARVLKKPGRHSQSGADPPDGDDASADGGHAPTRGSDEDRRRVTRELEKLSR
ncbi:MAG: cytochrome c-type biogenesis protein CcmH [Proteobacteria bacterium]|nr:cytochrome c-type biogenesis protein CcmH [Pseudomonadota bacterium]